VPSGERIRIAFTENKERFGAISVDCGDCVLLCGGGGES
jgi:hypothetical protein